MSLAVRMRTVRMRVVTVMTIWLGQRMGGMRTRKRKRWKQFTIGQTLRC